MISSRLEKVIVFLFKRIISLNKCQFTSLPFSAIILALKCMLGTFLVMALFFANETAFDSITPIIKSALIMDPSSQNTSSIMISCVLSLMNIIIGLLFLNCFRKRQSEAVDNLLLILLITLETFKYALVVLICSQIRLEILNGNLIFVIVNSVNLVFLLIWNFIFQNFYFSLNYSTKNILARFNLQIHVYSQIFLIVLVIVLSLIGPENLSGAAQLAFNMMYLAAKGISLYVALLKCLYVNKTMQEVHTYIFMLQIVTITANIIIQLTNENLLKGNFFYCILITATFCFLGWKSFFEWTKEDIYFMKGKQIKDSIKATIYLKALYDILSKVEHNESNSLILASIRKQHQFQCKNHSCYCHNSSENTFMREYSIEQLQDLKVNFKNNPKVLIQELNLKFYMFHAYPDILTRLQQIKTHFSLPLTDKYSLLMLKSDVIKLIEEKNIAANTIDVESPLRLEQISSKLQTIIKKDIEKKTKKWKYLSRGICRIQELQQDTNLEITYLKQITKIHMTEMPNFRRSILFNLLIMFYYKKISFLNVKTDEIQKNLNEQLKKIKEQELFSTKEFAKWIFHKRSCVIESLIDDQSMGLVTRSSKNVYEMFGYHQNKVIGMNLNKLMPTFMAGAHDNIIKDWIKTGTWRTVGKLKEIFCIHKDDFCFTALIYLKVIANEKGLFFVGVIFKKNESDYMILNQKQEVEGVGRKFLHLIGQNCRRLPIKILCDEFPTLDMTKQQDYKYFVKTFRSLNGNISLAEQYMQEKNRRGLLEEEEKVFLQDYQKKMEQQQLEIWEVKFGLKAFRMRELVFYVVLLNYARRLSADPKDQAGTGNRITEENIITNSNKVDVIIGTGKINENEQFDIESQNEPSDRTINERQAQFYQEKNSSMVSYAQRQSFTLTKLLKVFYDFLIHPEDIKNKRISTLNISTLLQTLMLSTIISVSFFIYITSLNEIKSYVSVNSQINEGMQLAILMYNKVISFSEYKNNTETLNKIVVMTNNDLNDFYQSLAKHVKNINQATSDFHSEQLYQYLKSPVNYMYSSKKYREVQVLQFLEYYYYMTTEIRKNLLANTTVDVLDQNEFQLDRIKHNFPRLKEISVNVCRLFSKLTQDTKSDLVMAAWIGMMVFFVVTLIFFLYSYNYFSFRHTQKHECLQIYKTIPGPLIDSIKEYYSLFHTELFSSFSTLGNSKSKTVAIESDMENLNKNELIIEDNSNYIHNNKIKFIGKQRFTGWIRSLFMFIAINAINMLTTYEIMAFVEPIEKFMTDINNIMDAENKQLQSYLDIKGAYMLTHKKYINTTVIDNILAYMSQSEVAFNQMVMFESQTLTQYDPGFYSDFYQILVDNVCLQIRGMISEQEFKVCSAIAKGRLIQDGIITYMNYFQRKLRSALEDLKVNSTLRLESEGKSYFINRGFQEIDLGLSYSVKLFRKLIQRILQGYMKGIDYISFINAIVLVTLIVPQVISLVLWFHLVKEEKGKLSILYGSILMIPPNVVRHVKNLPRTAKKILEFSES